MWNMAHMWKLVKDGRSMERVMCGTRLTYGNLVKDRGIYGESNVWNTAHMWKLVKDGEIYGDVMCGTRLTYGNLVKDRRSMERVMCGTWLTDRIRVKDLKLALGVNETIGQMAMANSAH